MASPACILMKGYNYRSVHTWTIFIARSALHKWDEKDFHAAHHVCVVKALSFCWLLHDHYLLMTFGLALIGIDAFLMPTMRLMVPICREGNRLTRWLIPSQHPE